jgi:site-specific DNA-methyltransferase (adenine-specific)
MRFQIGSMPYLVEKVRNRTGLQWKHEPVLYGWKEGAAHNWYSDRKQTTIIEFNKPLRSEDHPTKPVDLLHLMKKQ